MLFYVMLFYHMLQNKWLVYTMGNIAFYNLVILNTLLFPVLENNGQINQILRAS